MKSQVQTSKHPCLALTRTEEEKICHRGKSVLHVARGGEGFICRVAHTHTHVQPAILHKVTSQPGAQTLGTLRGGWEI